MKRILLFILLSFSVYANGQYYTIPVENTVVDNGWYNGFPFPFQLQDGRLIVIYKQSPDHASKGPMTIRTSYNGGATWSAAQITIAGVPKECAALSVGLLAGGRILVAYQDDELYTSIKFCYSDDNGSTWTASASVLSNGTGLSISPVKMRILPSGKILCGYYTGYGASEDAEIGFMVSTNSGSTWSFGSTIYDDHDGSGFGMNKGFEFAYEIVENTGVDATCKMVAYVRNADASPYMHYKSVDGGTTWTTDLVGEADPGDWSKHYFYNIGYASSQAPLDLMMHNGLLFIITGYRNTTTDSSFTIRYTTASVEDALDNNYYNYSRLKTLSTHAQNDVHFGYPILFHIRGESATEDPELWEMHYDVSPNAPIGGMGSPRCLIEMQNVFYSYPMPTGDYIAGIITTGGIWNAPTENLMTTYGLRPGDCLTLPAGNINHIDLMGYYNRIWIMPSSSSVTTVTRINWGDYGKHPSVSGTVGVSRNLVIQNSWGGYFASGCRGTGMVLYRNIKVQHCFMGIQVESRLKNYATFASFPGTGLFDFHYRDLSTGIYYYWDGDTYEVTPFPIQLQVQNVYTGYVDVDSVNQEAFYYGADVGSDIHMDGVVEYCTTNNTGRDGIQCRNGRWTIRYCTVDSTGLNNEDAHGHGILIGGNGGGGTSYIQNCTVTNAWNYGLFSNGYDTIKFINNNVQSRNAALLTKNYESDTEDILGIGFQYFYVDGNTFNTTVGTEGVDMRRDPVKCPVGVYWCTNNTILDGARYIETFNGIAFTEADCSVPLPPDEPNRKSGKWKYHYNKN